MAYRLLTDPNEISALVANGIHIEYTACYDKLHDQSEDLGGWIDWGVSVMDYIGPSELRRMFKDCPRDKFRIKL